MPDFNDVVRHVILRMVVDQGTLAEDIAKARGRLKDLEKAERDTNSSRVKDSDRVTKAIAAQTKSLEDNIAATDRLSKASGSNADNVAEKWRDAAKATQQSTAATNEATKAARESADAENRRQIARDNAAASRLTTNETKHKEADARVRAVDEASAKKLAALQKQLDDEQFIRRMTQAQRLKQAEEEIGNARRRATAAADQSVFNASSAGSNADTAATRSNDAEDAFQFNAAKRRADAIRQEEIYRQHINNLASQGNVLDQRGLEIAERRARAAEKAEQTAARSVRRRGLSGALSSFGSLIADSSVLAGRTAFTAPRAARRAATTGFDDEQVVKDLSSSTSDLRREASTTEKIVASLFGVFRRDGSSALTSMSRLRTATNDLRTDFNRFNKDSSGLFSGFKRGVTDMSGGATRVKAGFSTLFSEIGGRGSAAVGAFGRRLRTEGDDGLKVVQRLRAGFGGLFEDLNRPRRGSGGNSLFTNIVKNFEGVITGVSDKVSQLGRHALSFQSIIVAVIAALGPIAAVLGAAGAAAAGLAADLVALSGVLYALPGLITAAVAAFGVLAIVMKPLSNAFTAFAAAQKASANGSAESSKAALDATRKYQDAQRRLQDAETAHKRALEDLPRAYDKLSQARKQATRDLQDYTLAQQKLKFDAEGSALDVESAQRDYRRTLVDPTATSLDRRIARHQLEGSLFDQRDQKVSAERLNQDAAEAFKKGVDGLDAVVSALRAVADAERAKSDTLLDQTRATQDLTEAQKEQAAGGAAAKTAADNLAAAIGGLGPKTRIVAEAIFDLDDKYKALQKRLSDDVFGKLSGDTGLFKDVLAELESFLTPTATALGELAHQALLLFTNPDWKKFFATQGDAAGSIIQRLGEAALSAADGFKAIVETAQPFTDFVVDGIKGMADGFKQFTESDEGRKKLAAFLDITKQTMKELKPVVVDLVKGFYGFFQALTTPDGDKGESFTTKLNKGLGGIAKTFANLGAEAAKPNSGFRQWLKEVGPLIKDVAHFLGQVGKFFGTLFSDKRNVDEASRILTNLGEKVLPAIAKFFGELSASGLISKIAAGIGLAVEGVNKFLDAGGGDALSKFASSFKIAGNVIDGLLTTISNFPAAIKAIGAVAAVVFGGAIVAKFTGLNALIKGAITGLKNIRGLLTDGTDVDGSGNKPGRVKRAATNILDRIKDTATGKQSGTSAAEREGRNTGKTPDLSGTGGTTSILGRIERYARQIEINTRRYGKGGSGGGGTGFDDDPNGPRDTTTKDKRGKRSRGRGGRSGAASILTNEIIDDVSGADARRSRRSPYGGMSDYDDAPRRSGSIAGYDPIDTSRSRSYTIPRRQAGTDFDIVDSGRTRSSLRPDFDIVDSGPLSTAQRPASGLRRGINTGTDLELYNPNSRDLVPYNPRREATAQPRDERSGQFRRTRLGEEPTELNRGGGGRFTATPGRRPELPGLADVGRDESVYRNSQGRPAGRRTFRSVLSRLGRAAFPASDEGASGFFGLGRREATTGGGRAGRGGFFSRLFGRGRGGLAASVLGEAGDIAGDVLEGDVLNDAEYQSSRRARSMGVQENLPARRGVPEAGSARRGGRLSRLFRRGGGRAAGGVARGGLARVGGGLLRGAAGGVGGLIASAGLALGGQALIDNFVKDDDDANSLTRGLGAVANGAGIGATIGSVIPGIGTVAGGAVGGLIGGAYSLVKDKNLRNFVGGKISSGAKAVGGFVSGAADKVGDFASNLFGGGKDDGKGFDKVKGLLGGLVAGPIGLLIGGTGLGGKILDSLKKAGGGIADFFTKTIPHAFTSTVKTITTFFTKTLPELPKKAIDGLVYLFARGFIFLTEDLPRVIRKFFLKDLPHFAAQAWGFVVTNLWDPFVAFIKGIPGFFTETIPHWFDTASHWVNEKINKPISNFILHTIPDFFTETIPKWFAAAPGWFDTHVIKPVTSFFTESIPRFFTETLPNAIKNLPGVLYDNLVQPVLDFFKGLKDHVGDLLKGGWGWVKGLFSGVGDAVDKGKADQRNEGIGRMSGGLVEGVYQGIEDTQKYRLTPEEFVVRRSASTQPGAKAFLSDFNEGRIKMSDLYGGLSATASPSAMSLVPADAVGMTGSVPTVVNHTVNHAPLMGDVTIHNPVREKSERSLRRQVQVAAIRHRR